MDKSCDENPTVQLRSVFRVTEFEDENDTMMFTYSFGNPEFVKILELKMM